MRNEQRGIAPLIIIAIVALSLVVLGTGGYFGYKALKKKKTMPLAVEPALTESVETEVDGVLPPKFMALDISGTGLDSGELPKINVGGEFDLGKMDFDLSGLTAPDFSLSAPDATLAAPPVPNMVVTDFDFSGTGSRFAAQAEAKANQQQPPPAENPETPAGEPTEPPPSAPPPQSQVNAANCVQFSSMPDASYCDMVGDPSGAALCADCKAAGL